VNVILLTLMGAERTTLDWLELLNSKSLPEVGIVFAAQFAGLSNVLLGADAFQTSGSIRTACAEKLGSKNAAHPKHSSHRMMVDEAAKTPCSSKAFALGELWSIPRRGTHHRRWITPPSMSYAEPVINPASSEHRNATSAAISAGSAIRPMGCVAESFANISFSWPG
jgi:hypothetical protein